MVWWLGKLALTQQTRVRFPVWEMIALRKKIHFYASFTVKIISIGWESNAVPFAPEVRVMPQDQRAVTTTVNVIAINT